MARKKKNRFSKPDLILAPDTKTSILIIFLVIIAILSFLAILNAAGSFGLAIKSFWQFISGWIWWIWPFVLILIAILLFIRERFAIKAGRWVGLILFLLSLSGILQLFTDENTLETVKVGVGGGILGYLVAMPLEKVASFWGSLFIFIGILLISILIFFETSINSILDKLRLPGFHIFDKEASPRLVSLWLKKIRARKKAQEINGYESNEVGFESREIDAGEIEQSMDENIPKKQTEMFPTPKKKYTHIEIPLSLLNDKTSKPTFGDIKANQEIIKNTLANFGIDVEMAEVSVGPTVTQFTFKPASGVKVSQITTLNNDLALALAAHPIRIEAPIPGKALVGIEVPNEKIALVSLKETLSTPQYKNRSSNLMIALGKDVAGQPWLTDLDRMPHLLVAGATNSGKTVCLNSIIVSLLYQNQPPEMKLILVDPKRVEMTQYNDIPHLITPVITDVKKTVNALRWSVNEMERRFEVLHNSGKRNIQTYNASNPPEKMPYLIIVVDELADLMTVAAQEIEQAVVRLAQKARAVGIHLVLATQRPSVNIITGLIKANITARIAFSVASGTDSRTILDFAGAEKLLGRGDMLFISADLSKPKRLQGAFLSDEEIHRVVSYLKSKGEPEYNEEIIEKQKALAGSNHSSSFIFNEDDDELLPEAKETVIKAGKASASYLQRRLRIGYARAARLLDLLEDQGIVGPGEGSKPREVYGMPEELAADEILGQTKNEEIINNEDYNQSDEDQQLENNYEYNIEEEENT